MTISSEVFTAQNQTFKIEILRSRFGFYIQINGRDISHRFETLVEAQDEVRLQKKVRMMTIEEFISHLEAGSNSIK